MSSQRKPLCTNTSDMAWVLVGSLIGSNCLRRIKFSQIRESPQTDAHSVYNLRWLWGSKHSIYGRYHEPQRQKYKTYRRTETMQLLLYNFRCDDLTNKPVINAEEEFLRCLQGELATINQNLVVRLKMVMSAAHCHHSTRLLNVIYVENHSK